MKRNVILYFVFIQIQLLAQLNTDNLSDMQWKCIGNPGFTSESANFLSLAFNPVDGLPWVAFQESMVISVMRFNGNEWEYAGLPGFSISQGGYTSLVFCPLDNSPYVAYSIFYPNPGPTVRRFDGTSWSTVGVPYSCSSWVVYTDLKFNPLNGNPYVVFSDNSDSLQATLITFDDNQWVPVGPIGFTPEAACYTRLAFDSVGFPYVAYSGDYFNPDIKASVMKYNGGQWEYVGTPGISAGPATNTNLAFSSTGILYIAYCDVFYGRRVTVKMYDGINWITCGVEGFTFGMAQELSLAIGPDDQPYIAYTDFGHSDHASVMKYNGTNWIYIGPPGFSNDTATFTNLAFNMTGNSCLAFQDWGYSGKTTVMIYDYPFGESEKINSFLSVYPNPTSSNLYIEMIESTNTKNIVEIFNAMGQLVINTYFKGKDVMLDVNKLPRGMYYVKISSETSIQKRIFCKN